MLYSLHMAINDMAGERVYWIRSSHIKT